MAYNHNKIEFVLEDVAQALWHRSYLDALAQGTCVRCGKRISHYGMSTARLRQCLDLALCLACLRELEVENENNIT